MTGAVSGTEGSRSVDTWLHEHAAGLIAFRRRLHAHPELSGEEYATTEAISERLELGGVPFRPLASGTGLIAELRPEGADGHGCFAIRSDIDALAMHDEKDVSYRSQVPGVAHACGHDVHTAIGLGTALYFSHHTDELPGPLRVIFQPAEERVPGGARDVLADNGLDGVEVVVGVHCEPKMDVGRIGLRGGPISSAADMACISLHGPGGHTARPELTADLVALGAKVITDLPTLVAKELPDPTQVKVVFGMVHAGDAANVIPSHLDLRASVRTPLTDVWEQLPGIFSRCLESLLEGSGAEHTLDYTHGVPAVINDSAVTEMVQRAARTEFGTGATYEATQSWGGDDFAWLTREVPGSYVRLGVHDPEWSDQLDLHAGHFDVDERAIALGVRLMVASIHEHFSP